MMEYLLQYISYPLDKLAFTPFRQLEVMRVHAK